MAKTNKQLNYDSDIKPGERVRSFDFPWHLDDMDREQLLHGERAAYIEGTVIAVGEFEDFPDCDRYKIKVERRVWQGKQKKPFEGETFVYPPVNGTPTTFGDIMTCVERIK